MADNKQNTSTKNSSKSSTELNPLAEELKNETMKVRQQLVEQQQQARTCTNPQEQAACAAAVNRTVGDVLDTEKEWRNRQQADEKKGSNAAKPNTTKK